MEHIIEEKKHVPIKIQPIDADDDVVTYQELEGSFSHFEIAFLSFNKAIELIRSGVDLNEFATQKHMKPKVAVVALHTLCQNPEETKQFAAEVLESMTAGHNKEEEVDNYNVDEGHLPGYGEAIG